METKNHNRLGTLMYGKQIIAEQKPFSILEGIKKELLLKGYDSSLFHKHYKPQAMQTQQIKPQAAPLPATLTSTTEKIKSLLPTSTTDGSWYYMYVDKIGEDTLFKLKNYIYDLCRKLQVGEHLDIDTWTEHIHKKCVNFKNWKHADTLDLVVKIFWCYMTESNGCYCFSNDYKQFRNYIEECTIAGKKI